MSRIVKKSKLYSVRRNRGFTLIEIMVAASMMGFALVTMIALHAQAIRSNMHAKRMTDCTYLAQARMELLHTIPWTSASSPPTVLSDISGVDPTSSADPWTNLEHPSGGPNARSAGNDASQGYAYGPRAYYVSWDIENMDSDLTWVRIRVRCKYLDRTFSQWKGTTISSYRFRDSS
jgi:prepilin-type N-terminal cleavage/methylation domain-containing protein